MKSGAQSITSSARAKIDCGIVRPRAFAAWRLITNSNLVGCSTEIGGIGTSQTLDQLSGQYTSEELDDARAMGGEPSLLGSSRPLVYRRKA
jgi:hypothetical protein